MRTTILILEFFIAIVFYILGFYIGRKDGIQQVREIAVTSNLRLSRIKMIIRSHRNMILREETRLKELPSDKHENHAIEYLSVKAKKELIQQIEKEVANEM